MSSTARQIEAFVLAVHRRNGGPLVQLDFQLKLLAPSLELDSLDLAEVMVAIENEFRRSPFDSPSPPRIWADIVSWLDNEITCARDAAR